MPDFKPLTRKDHADLYWSPPQTADFASGQHIVPVVLEEVPRLMHEMPLVFVRSEAGYRLVAVMSLEAGENWFVSRDGKWRGGYLPAQFRAHPFHLARVTGDQRRVLCVAREAVLEKGQNPFFDAQGNLSAAVKERYDLLISLEKNRAATASIVQSLADAGVFVPWKLQGLYKVDEAVINSLEEKGFLALRKALPLVYGHLYSLSRVEVLNRMQSRRQDEQKQTEELRQVLGWDE